MWRRRKPRDPEIESAKRRLADAERDLEAAKGDSAKVDRAAWSIHEIRKANRFAAMMKQALGAK